MGLSILFSSDAQASLKQSVDELLETLPLGTIYGVEVRKAGSGETIYRRNSYDNLLPASILKLPTAIAAYHKLGAEFRYQTTISSQKMPVKGKRFVGDLKLTFSGDPSLTHHDIAVLFEDIRQQGVRDVKGNLWLDNSVYNGYPRAGGTIWDDRNICFAAPAGAIILDRNCFYGWLKPGKLTGQPARMEYDAPDWKRTIDNRVITRYPTENEPQGCIQEVWPSRDYEYRLEGCIEPGQKPIRMAFAVNDAERAAQRYLRALLKQKGINLKGRILVGQPAGEYPHHIVTHQSEPLPVLLRRVLEKSDNIYADSILKTLGKELSGGAGSYYTGTQAIRQVMAEQNVMLSRSRLVDGSGLSRYNSLSAEDMVDMLSAGWQFWEDKAPWLSERETPEYWLKTGYMSGVNNMAGYAFPDQGEPLIFAVILNGLKADQQADAEAVAMFHENIRAFHKAFLTLLLGP